MKRHSGTVERREFASEIKFLIPPDRVESVRAWARVHLQPDPNGSGPDHDTYGITSLYFDTSHFDVFHGSGSFGRSKYRVRRYNGNETVFLERKTKTRTWVSKRRSLVGVETMPLLKDASATGDWPGFWFHRRLLGRQLHPVCQISYLRTARVGMAEGHPIRLTLDRDLRASARGAHAFDDRNTGTPLLDQKWILELKYRHALPAIFKRLITELAPAPQRVSKYRLAVTALGLAVPTPASAQARLAEGVDA
ncbi:MAG: polyphosphate polymerase domain-containing protein [Steroidobacteraceae bacterium]